MDLREQYETLLRRGMPEHDELEWRGSEDFGIGVWVFSKNEPIQFGIGPVFMGERFARDLITMHAMRWVVDNEIELKRYVKWTVHDGFCIDTENGNGWQAHCDPLNAILVATAHLEPKKTLA